MGYYKEIFNGTGPASPAIELVNIDLLRQEGEVSPLVLDIYSAYYCLRYFIARLRQTQPAGGESPESESSPRNAWLSLE